MQKEYYKYTPVIYWNWLEVTDKEGEEKKIPFMRYYKLYNLEQCEGIRRPQTEAKPNNFTPIQQCENIVVAMPKQPQIKNGVPRAFYDPVNDRINLPGKELFVGPEEYYCTLFHEMVHSTGHGSRLKRKTLTEATYFGSTNYSKEELIAEMGAAFLCGHSGIDNVIIDNSSAYISGWLRKLKDDTRLVILAAAQAQKAVDYVTANAPS